jgi:hypothetical protein
MCIIDASGILVYKRRHRFDPVGRHRRHRQRKQYVRVGLDEVLAGKPVSDSSTRPYGCSLKYPRTST